MHAEHSVLLSYLDWMKVACPQSATTTMVCQTDTLQWRDASVEKSASPNPKPATASAMAQLVVAQQIASTLLPLCLEKYQQQQKVAEVICELQKTMKKYIKSMPQNFKNLDFSMEGVSKSRYRGFSKKNQKWPPKGEEDLFTIYEDPSNILGVMDFILQVVFPLCLIAEFQILRFQNLSVAGQWKTYQK